MEFVRCHLFFSMLGTLYKCDLQEGHSGQCMSLPDGPNKVATVMWLKEAGF